LPFSTPDGTQSMGVPKQITISVSSCRLFKNCQCDFKCTGGIWQSVGCSRTCQGEYDVTGPCSNEGEIRPGFCDYCP
jgi:hypothetical protein